MHHGAMLKDGDGPMGKGRHRLSWDACVGIAHPNPVRRGLPSPAGVVIFGTQSTGFRQCRAYTRPSRPMSHRSQPLCGGTFRFLATSWSLTRAALPFAPAARGVYLKGIFSLRLLFLMYLPFREPPLPHSKRPFTRRETRLAFSGRFNGLRIFGFQGTEVLVHPRSRAEEKERKNRPTYGRRH